MCIQKLIFSQCLMTVCGMISFGGLLSEQLPCLFKIHIIQNTLSRNPLFMKHKNMTFKKNSRGAGALECSILCTVNLKFLKIFIFDQKIMEYFVARMSHLLCGQLEPKGSPQPRKDPNRSIHPPNSSLALCLALGGHH